MKEYNLYVPLRSNEGRRLPKAKLNRLRKLLVARFGGLTYFPQKNKGFWKVGKVTFRDEIVILRVLAVESKKVRGFWKKLKWDLKREWKQRDVLIVTYEVTTI